MERSPKVWGFSPRHYFSTADFRSHESASSSTRQPGQDARPAGTSAQDSRLTSNQRGPEQPRSSSGAGLATALTASQQCEGWQESQRRSSLRLRPWARASSAAEVQRQPLRCGVEARTAALPLPGRTRQTRRGFAQLRQTQPPDLGRKAAPPRAAKPTRWAGVSGAHTGWTRSRGQRAYSLVVITLASKSDLT